MALVRLRRDPWGTLETLQDDLSRLWTNFPARALGTWPAEYRGTPRMDMWEDDKNVYFEADLPGMSPEDIKVQVQDSTLMVSAEKEETKEEKDRGYYLSERYSGSYYREMSLPSAVDADKVKASARDGVLKVTLPKKEKELQKSKRVEVTAG